MPSSAGVADRLTEFMTRIVRDVPNPIEHFRIIHMKGHPALGQEITLAVGSLFVFQFPPGSFGAVGGLTCVGLPAANCIVRIGTGWGGLVASKLRATTTDLGAFPYVVLYGPLETMRLELEQGERLTFSLDGYIGYIGVDGLRRFALGPEVEVRPFQPHEEVRQLDLPECSRLPI